MKIITWMLGTILVLGIGTAIGLRLFAGDPDNPKAHADPAKVTAACATKGVRYYANTAPKGSHQFGPDQSGHDLKANSGRFGQKLCTDPLFASVQVEFAKHGIKLDANRVQAQANTFRKDRKAWTRAVTQLLGQGTTKNKVKNPQWAVASYTVKYDGKSYETLGMVPHGAKKMPTLVKSDQSKKVGWAVILHLKNGQTRELRIACDFQPVGHTFSKVKATPTKSEAAPAPKQATPKITPVAHCTGKGCHPTPPPKHCTAGKGNGGSCASPPPPGCKSGCKPPPKCTHNCGGSPPKCTKDCSPPPKCPPGTTGKPPHCKTPPKKQCPCVTKTQVQQPVQVNNHVPLAAVQPTKGAPKQAPPVQEAKPVNNHGNNGAGATKAPNHTPNGSNSGSSNGSGTPSGSYSGGGHTSVQPGSGGNGHVTDTHGGNNGTDGNGNSTGGGAISNPF